MAKHQGFVDKEFPHHVYKLHKALYCLKQASRARFDRFSTHLLGLGFEQSYADCSLFVRHSQQSITVLLLYVDDLIITGTNSQYISHLISQLSMVFEMKNLGQLHHFLGIEVCRGPTGLFLSRYKYARDLLARTSMLDYKPYGSPCNYKGTSPSNTTAVSLDPHLYRTQYYWCITVSCTDRA